MIIRFFQIFILIFFIPNTLIANTQYFEEGLNLFKNKKFKEAKLKFEQDIVYNPKSEISYLYLSKIFKSLDKKKLYIENGKIITQHLTQFKIYCQSLGKNDNLVVFNNLVKDINELENNWQVDIKNSWHNRYIK